MVLSSNKMRLIAIPIGVQILARWMWVSNNDGDGDDGVAGPEIKKTPDNYITRSVNGNRIICNGSEMVAYYHLQVVRVSLFIC